MSSWFDRMYSGFLLRDFIAKVIPGSIVLLPVALLEFHEYVLLIGSVSLVLMLVLVALLCGYLFVVGMMLQQLGEILGWVTNSDKSDIGKDYKDMLGFGKRFKKSDCYERMIKERLTIIKEMSGNMGMALVLLALQIRFIIDAKHGDSYPFVFIVVVLLLLSRLCFKQNWDYYEREKEWMSRALGLPLGKRKRT